MEQRPDIIIVGAGPAGLACAIMAAREGLHVTVLEQAAQSELAAPRPDGRDIALTHRSLNILRALGAWTRLPPDEIAPIARATVRNAASGDLLQLTSDVADRRALGYLVANHVIRKTLYDVSLECPGITLITGVAVNDVSFDSASASVRLADDRRFSAPLVIAADSRFSKLRRAAGIGAEMRDFARLCIVCRMRHARPHDKTAIEWFDVDRTLALLPLNAGQSSVVLTLPTDAAHRTMALSAADFAADVERRFGGCWGAMELNGDRHAYPLVAVYAHSFHKPRFALIGDAAVGMHPVTAHGFNFGLRGAAALVREISRARRSGGDIGAVSVLSAYDREHRAATRPLYLATNAIVSLYTDNSPPARVAREALLRIGNFLAPMKGLIMRKLTEIDVPADAA